jgi:long-chain fatty acid transport protein
LTGHPVDRRRALAGAPLVALAVAPALEAGSPAAAGLAAAASDDAQSAMSNPAAMTRLDESAVSVSALVAYGFGDFVVDEDATTVDGGNPSSGAEPVLIPSLYYVRPLSERWRAGISFTIPTGFGSDYGGDWAGRYYTDNYSLVYVALTPALAYRFSERLSVGVASSINYTLSNGEVGINNLVPGVADGSLESELDGVGVSFSLSMLYELSDCTRLGLNYTSDSEADLDGDVKLRGLGPVLGPILEERGLDKLDIEVENTLPQRVVGGIYHEFDSGRYVTADVAWVDFSEFGTTGVALEGTDLAIDPPGIYDDIWALSIGAGFPIDERLTWKLGAMYLSQPIDEDDRGLSMRLDRIWGVGAGLSYDLGKGRGFDLNLTLIDYGEAPVDTGESLLRGRVVGENEDHYSLLLGVAYHL